MRKRLGIILTVLAFFAGILLLIYPSLSDYWNHVHQSEAIVEYTEKVRLMDEERFKDMWAEAEFYNAQLFRLVNGEEVLPSDMPEYWDVLNITGDGMMAYVEIPKINCRLPVMHGTEAVILQDSAGHFMSSTFPVGGINTHCILTGHRGLPSARLFTDLDLLEEGDIFFLETLGVPLYYEIDQISVVLPQDFTELEIVEGQDYCTLVTCTPYGVNSHRLLLRGHRVDEKAARANGNLDYEVDGWGGRKQFSLMAGIVSILIASFLFLLLGDGKNRKEEPQKRRKDEIRKRDKNH